jgi:starch synthase
MRILQIATECAPWAKAGGLGDVVFGLSRALAAAGHEVAVILPHYQGRFDQLEQREIARFVCPLDGQPRALVATAARAEGVELILIGEAEPGGLLNRPHPYGYEDDVLRMGFFCQAVLSLMRHQSWQVDVLHVHDWPTSLIPVLVREEFEPGSLVRGGVVLTLHNLEVQGLCPPDTLTRLGLNAALLMDEQRLQDRHHAGQANLLQGGILYADRLTTVSPTFAEEILHPPGGKGLEPLLRHYQWKLSGILNGLDFDYWNPATDPLLPVHFSAKHSASIAAQRQQLKHQLQRRCHLEEGDRPLFVTVSRLTPQKGLELIEQAIREVLRKGGQYVLQGSSPIPEIQAHFQALKLRLSSCRNVHFHLLPEESLTHWLFGCADAVVIPSLFEPCGLTQMIGMRYGAVPVVRETGGLRDTVFDAEYAHRPWQQRNGFTFRDADRPAIDWVIERVFAWREGKPRQFQELQAHGMQTDWSWDRPAAKYAQLYHSLIERNPLAQKA